MRYTYTLIFTVIFLFQAELGFAQCPPGEIEVTIEVQTDDYALDCYWDLTPSGNGCGNGTLYEGGNILEVFCGGGGASVANPGSGYPDNSVITENVGCVTIDDCFDINFVDDYGDGGTTFLVYLDGFLSASFTADGMTAEASYSFCANVPPAHDAEMNVQPFEYTAVPLSQVTNILVDGTIASAGTDNLTGVTMNVSVFFGPTEVYNQTSSAQTVNAGSSGTFSVPVFVPTGIGSYTVTYTAAMTEIEEDPANNSVSYSVFVTDSVYARDNGINTSVIGIGLGEPGYLGSQFLIADNISVSSISVMLGNQAGDITGNAFSVAVYSTDVSGTPVTLLGSAPGVVSGSADHWHTIKLSPAVYLAPGMYVFCISEEATYSQQVGTSTSVITTGVTYASWTGQSWDTFEALGSASQSLMIRPNLNDFSGVEESDAVTYSVYPNPTSGIVNIQNIQIGSFVELYNSAGQLVHSATIQNENTQLDLSGYGSGIYSMRISNGVESSITKLIVN